MTNYINKYIREVLSRNYSISVYDGEEWPVKKSTTYAEIKDAVWSVETGELRIRDECGDHIGTASYMIDNPDYDINDHTIDDNGIMEDLWHTAYNLEYMGV